jgi:ribonuclease HI
MTAMAASANESTALKQVTIFTDGAAVPNPGAGGYGVVLQFGPHRRELSGGFRRTTNNRMELMAVIVGLEALKERCKVTLHSDSQYIVNAVTSGAALRWRKNDWKFNPAGMKRAKNPDLWERLLAAYEKHEVEMVWVKGHAGLADNERCDTLAMAACKLADLPADPGYVEQTIEKPAGDRPPEKTAPKGSRKITAEGQPCRHCGTPVVKKVRHRRVSQRRAYYYAWTLFCENCKTMYLVEEAKRFVDKGQIKESGGGLFADGEGGDEDTSSAELS